MKLVDEAKIEAMKIQEARRRAQGAEPVAVEVSGGRFEVRRAGEAEKNLSEEVLPSRTIEGIRVDGKRTTITIPAGAIGNEWPIAIVNEEWTSPDLQVLVLTERKDPREGDSSYRLVHVVRNEPAASLFQVPPDYTIRATGIKRFERRQ
jgi:hypothetical protein